MLFGEGAFRLIDRQIGEFLSPPPSFKNCLIMIVPLGHRRASFARPNCTREQEKGNSSRGPDLRYFLILILLYSCSSSKRKEVGVKVRTPRRVPSAVGHFASNRLKSEESTDFFDLP